MPVLRPQSESNLRLQLNHPRGIIASVTAQNTGGGLRRVGNLPKRRVRESAVRLGEIGVVEYVEELESYSQLRIFPWNFRVLQNR